MKLVKLGFTLGLALGVSGVAQAQVPGVSTAPSRVSVEVSPRVETLTEVGSAAASAAIASGRVATPGLTALPVRAYETYRAELVALEAAGNLTLEAAYNAYASVILPALGLDASIDSVQAAAKNDWTQAARGIELAGGLDSFLASLGLTDQIGEGTAAARECGLLESIRAGLAPGETVLQSRWVGIESAAVNGPLIAEIIQNAEAIERNSPAGFFKPVNLGADHDHVTVNGPVEAAHITTAGMARSPYSTPVLRGQVFVTGVGVVTSQGQTFSTPTEQWTAWMSNLGTELMFQKDFEAAQAEALAESVGQHCQAGLQGSL